MVQSYWQVGHLIVEHEQQGQQRAAYGKQQLQQLSKQLTLEFGKGFDASNLRNMRRFYMAFPIQETVSLKLSWSHYNCLSRIENPKARAWYQHPMTLNFFYVTWRMQQRHCKTHINVRYSPNERCGPHQSNPKAWQSTICSCEVRATTRQG